MSGGSGTGTPAAPQPVPASYVSRQLTTIARYKSYVGILASNTAADAQIGQLITRASSAISKYCSRNFGRTVTTGGRFDGTGSDRMMLPNTPIISVASLGIDSTATIAASADAIASGYQFDDTTIYLFGYRFTKGRRNVLVSYTGGYTSSETDLIPASPGPYTITPTTGDSDGNDGAVLAVADLGVVNASTGAALVAVPSGTTPTTWQYSFLGGTYTFAGADHGVSVTMSYDYVPGAVEQACIELVAMKVKKRDNIGVASRAIGGETITYTNKDISQFADQLGPYNRKMPV